MLVGLRDRLIRNRTQLANAIRGYAAEFGLTAAKGMCKIEPLLASHCSRRDAACPGARAVRVPRRRNMRSLQAQLDEGRGQADGLASSRRMQPAPGADPGRRSDRRVDAGDEDADARSLPIGSSFCRLARPDTKGSLDGRQGQARGHHPRRRRGFAQRAGGWRHCRDPAGRDAVEAHSRPGLSSFSSASRRSSLPWRWPTRWPASPGS